VFEANSIERQVFERLGKFRQKVITHRIFQGKSLQATARACGCTPDKVRRVIHKWQMLCRQEKWKETEKRSADSSH